MYRQSYPPFRPPFTPPFGPPFNQQRPPQNNNSDNRRPPGPPPSEIPKKGPSLKAVDPGSIRFCKYKYTYIWLNNGRSFWTYLTYVGRQSIGGWRWFGRGRRGRWAYFGTDIRNVSDFVCY